MDYGEPNEGLTLVRNKQGGSERGRNEELRCEGIGDVEVLGEDNTHTVCRNVLFKFYSLHLLITWCTIKFYFLGNKIKHGFIH